MKTEKKERDLRLSSEAKLRTESLLSTQAWAITPTAFEMLTRSVNICDAGVVVPREVQAQQQRTLGTTSMDGVAVIDVVGPIVPYETILGSFFGFSSYERLGEEFGNAANNDECAAILLNIDSPGGTLAGSSEFARMVREASAIKPVLAYASGQMCSAAYWIGSAASQIVAQDTSEIGSLGVMRLWFDDRERNEKQGIRENKIVSSQTPLKNSDPTNGERLKSLQQVVNDAAEIFLNTVAKNRGVSRTVVDSEFGRGATMLAQRAKRAGMIDEVGGVDVVEDALSTLISKRNLKMFGKKKKDSTEALEGESEVSDVSAKATSSPERCLCGFCTSDSTSARADFLCANHPALYDVIYNAGVSDERKRLQEIDDLKLDDADSLVNEAKYKKPLSAESLAFAYVKHTANERTKVLNEHRADAAAIPEIEPSEGTTMGNEDAAKQASLDKNIEMLKAARGQQQRRNSNGNV